VGLTPDNLRRLFRQYFGITPSEYRKTWLLTHRRIDFRSNITAHLGRSQMGGIHFLGMSDKSSNFAAILGTRKVYYGI
jgi:methylphosphotriester-DNA--protein-cysteine methyltransferase